MKKLINVKMKDGSVKPIFDVTADNVDEVMELVETDEGFEIRIKEGDTFKDSLPDQVTEG